MERVRQEVSRHSQLLLAVVLLLLFARLSGGARHNSFTSDEPSHIASGYAYWARHTFWTVPLRGHPLLINAWSALPVYLGNPHIPLESLRGWEEDNTRYVQSFTPYLTANLPRAEVAARTPVMLLSVLLAAIVARWAVDLWGTSGGLLAALVMLCDPTLLAHGMLATNDLGVTALGTASLFVVWRCRSRRGAVVLRPYGPYGVAGLLLGLTMLAKGSGVLWLGAAWLMLAQQAGGARLWVRRAATLSGIALLVVWAGYDFEWGRVPGLPFPLPAPTHWEAIFLQSAGAAQRHTYLLGHVAVGKRWDYFPIAFLVKNPLPFLAMIAGGTMSLRSRLRDLPWLWGLPLLYLLTAMAVGVNIGYRHLYPIHPFLYLICGALAAVPPSRWQRGAMLGGVAWLAAESLWAAPNYLGYFNQLTGGARGGWRVLADSNTDWGQGYKQLRDFQQQRGVRFRYAGPRMYVDPKDYGVTYDPLPPSPDYPAPLWPLYLYPAPGDYVISAVVLSGQQLIDPDTYAWFRYRPPDAILAQSLFYYHVPALAGESWLAQCEVPAVPLDAAHARAGFGGRSLRQLTFDCTQTWVYPHTDGQRGWYGLHAALFRPSDWRERLGHPPTPQDPFIARHLRPYPLSFRQWDYRELPAFAIFRADERRDAACCVLAATIAPAETIPDLLGPPQSYESLRLDGPLTLIGLRTYPQRDSLEVETWWRVDAAPITRPFSIMAHLVRGNGQPLAVADGLGVAPQALRQGDVVVQRHRFPAATADAWLRLGAYWLDNQRRWPIARSPNCDAIFIKP